MPRHGPSQLSISAFRFKGYLGGWGEMTVISLFAVTISTSAFVVCY